MLSHYRTIISQLLYIPWHQPCTPPLLSKHPSLPCVQIYTAPSSTSAPAIPSIGREAMTAKTHMQEIASGQHSWWHRTSKGGCILLLSTYSWRIRQSTWTTFTASITSSIINSITYSAPTKVISSNTPFNQISQATRLVQTWRLLTWLDTNALATIVENYQVDLDTMQEKFLEVFSYQVITWTSSLWQTH